MRFVASTILSVAILAFVAQSVSAVPADPIKNVDEVNQESTGVLKRDALDDFYEDCVDGLASLEECIAEFGPDF